MSERIYPGLGDWYAKPLSKEEAHALLARAEARQSRHRLRGTDCLTCRLTLMVARFWLGEAVEDDFRMLESLTARRYSARGRVLSHLIYGQLLMSRRMAGAGSHLEHAFMDARHLFAPAEYFAVLNRHTLLRRLPLSREPMPAEDLAGLLAVAGVVDRLVGPVRPAFGLDRTDIFG